MGLDSLINKIETRSEDISDDEYLKNIMEEAVVRRNNENLSKPSQYYSPSKLGGCIRQLYYKRVGAEIDDKQDISCSNILKGEAGNDRHERIQQLLVEISEEYDYDFEWVDVQKFVKQRHLDHLDIVGMDDTGYEALVVDTRYDIRFRVDGIIKIKNRYYLLEIKTDDTYKWRPRNTVSDYHETQGICYSLSFEVDNVMYLYEDRNQFLKKPIIFKVNDKMRKRVIDKIATVEKYVERGELPPKGDCTFCLYKQICEKNVNPVGDD